ncbi:hypothetical protein MTsPCn5_19670 [Croceitalea sp. MTPC5]|uniref:sensor histidine kinase n=1 Tax=Croceitalea sp. MTPC5 TaxID=3056565 RepID=UPI002B3C7C93|nr:hypothetical protein MTsPCn5_19670 [Croceitalea sp. MTPC5]
MELTKDGTALVRKDRSDIAWAVNVAYQLTFFNAPFERQFIDDFKITPTLGMDLSKVDEHNVFFKACRMGYAAAFEGQSIVYQSTVGQAGNEKIFEFSFLPFCDISGTVIGCSAWQKDITEESKAISLLEDRDQKYNEAQQIANVGHWNWDILKNEIRWSDQLFRVFGQEPGTFEATYEALMEIIHSEDRAAFNADVERALNEKVLHDIVHRIRIKGDEIRYVHQKGRAFYDVSGKPVRMAGTTQDVTTEILANQKIVEQNLELGHFVHVISHNLKGPISNLLMLLSIYEWGRDVENDTLLKKFEITTKALDQTMKDLSLSLSLKEVDSVEFRDIFFEKAMDDVLGLLAEEIERSNAKLLIDFSKAPTVKGIKSYVVNMLYNLILNAISYRDKNREPLVKISTVLETSTLILTVSDNGIGMNLTPERRKKIFDMYGRLSGQTKGKGLGLYLVKTQVEAMNGSITVESKKGVGSTFVLKFEV